MANKKAEEKVNVGLADIDYKNPGLLKRYLSNRYKVLPQKISGLSAKKQRKLKTEVKKARIMALLPFTDRHAIR